MGLPGSILQMVPIKGLALDQGKPLPEEEAEASHPPPGPKWRRGFTETPDCTESLSKSAVSRISLDSPHPLLHRLPALPLSGVLTACHPTQTSPPSPSPLTLTPPLSIQITIPFSGQISSQKPTFDSGNPSAHCHTPSNPALATDAPPAPAAPPRTVGSVPGPCTSSPSWDPVATSGTLTVPCSQKTHEPNPTQSRLLWFAYSFSASCGLHFSVCP